MEFVVLNGKPAKAEIVTTLGHLSCIEVPDRLEQAYRERFNQYDVNDPRPHLEEVVDWLYLAMTPAERQEVKERDEFMTRQKNINNI